MPDIYRCIRSISDRLDCYAENQTIIPIRNPDPGSSNILEIRPDPDQQSCMGSNQNSSRADSKSPYTATYGHTTSTCKN